MKFCTLIYKMKFCQYKDVLGVPEQGIHQYRLFGFAIVDVVMTIIGSYFLSMIINQPFWLTLLVIFVSGVFLHWLFCVETTFNKLVGLA